MKFLIGGDEPQATPFLLLTSSHNKEVLSKESTSNEEGEPSMGLDLVDGMR